MALISCSECGKKVSSKAASCPHCGLPLTEMGERNSMEIEDSVREQQSLPKYSTRYIQTNVGKGENFLCKAGRHEIIFVGPLLAFVGTLVVVWDPSLAPPVVGIISLCSAVPAILITKSCLGVVVMYFISFGVLHYIILNWGIAVSALCFIWLAYCFMVYINSEFSLTNQKLTTKTGVIDRNIQELRIEKIESVNVTQHALGRFFGYGTIEVRGVGGGVVSLPDISSPFEFEKRLKEMLHST